MFYIDIKKVYSFQNTLISIFEEAVNFCKIIKGNFYCNKGHNNKKCITLKSEIKNLSPRVFILSKTASKFSLCF